jgi:hypothetical protein
MSFTLSPEGQCGSIFGASCCPGYVKMVTMLLEQRADANHQDKGGTTALTSAAAAWLDGRDPGIVSLLDEWMLHTQNAIAWGYPFKRSWSVSKIHDPFVTWCAWTGVRHSPVRTTFNIFQPDLSNWVHHTARVTTNKFAFWVS